MTYSSIPPEIINLIISFVPEYFYGLSKEFHKSWTHKISFYCDTARIRLIVKDIDGIAKLSYRLFPQNFREFGPVSDVINSFTDKSVYRILSHVLTHKLSDHALLYFSQIPVDTYHIKYNPFGFSDKDLPDSMTFESSEFILGDIDLILLAHSLNLVDHDKALRDIKMSAGNYFRESIKDIIKYLDRHGIHQRTLSFFKNDFRDIYREIFHDLQDCPDSLINHFNHVILKMDKDILHSLDPLFINNELLKVYVLSIPGNPSPKTMEFIREIIIKLIP